MNNNARNIFIICVFSVFGAWLSLTFLPPVLENLYTNLSRLNGQDPKSVLINSEKPDPVKPKTTPEEISSGEVENSTDQPAEETTTSTSEQSQPKPASKLGETEPPSEIPQTPINPFAIGLLGLIAGAGLGTIVVRQLESFNSKWDKMPMGDRITIILGSFLGIVVGIIVSLPFQVAFQGKPEGALVTLGLITGCGAASVNILRTMSDILPWETTVQARKRSGKKIFDTNVLIDGRVYDLLRSGFIEGEIYIPNFVLLELQHIADSADALRRQRGRRGLDVLKRIQSEFEVTIGESDKYAGNEKDEVDTRLVRLALALGADLVSNDYNLNKVATIKEIRVLNINELALALRPTILPGEPLEVNVVKDGSQVGQGVGYLDDGTMVVIEHGSQFIGHTILASVSQVIQTERGKMIFADASQVGQDPTNGQ